jgi:hypothetical protein
MTRNLFAKFFHFVSFVSLNRRGFPPPLFVLLLKVDALVGYGIAA